MRNASRVHHRELRVVYLTHRLRDRIRLATLACGNDSQIARVDIRANLARGNRDFAEYPTLFARDPLRWTPATARREAPLTDVFPRDEFYLNNHVEGTQGLLRPSDIMLHADSR